MDRESLSEDVLFKMRTEGWKSSQSLEDQRESSYSILLLKYYNIQNNYRVYIKDIITAKGNLLTYERLL